MGREAKPKCLFGRVLHSLMKKRGANTYSFEGVAQSLVAMYLSCRRLPDVSTLVYIAKNLSLTPAEEYKLYRARLIVDEKKPLWDKEVVDKLKSARVLSQQEVERLIKSKLKENETLTGFAYRHNLDPAVLQKLVKLQPVEVLAYRRTTLPLYFKALKLTPEEGADLLLTLLYTMKLEKRRERRGQTIDPKEARDRFIKILKGET